MAGVSIAYAISSSAIQERKVSWHIGHRSSALIGVLDNSDLALAKIKHMALHIPRRSGLMNSCSFSLGSESMNPFRSRGFGSALDARSNFC